MGPATPESLEHGNELQVNAYSFETTPWDEEEDALVQIACTAASTLFLTGSGKIYRCGTVHGRVRPSLTRTVIQLPLKCVEIAAGRHFGLARMEGGLAVCSWGAGHFGQLGLGSDSAPCIEHPTVIDSLLPHVVGSPIATIAAGYWHAMAVTEAGHLYSWGCNRNAQCGMKPTKDPPTICAPQLVRFETAKIPKIEKVAAGRSHSAALDEEGSIYCWGACQYGQCGILSRRRGGVAPPKHVEALDQVNIVDIAAGDSHTLALTGGGRVFGWGSGFEGQLGTGSIVQMNPKPKLVGDLDFVAIEAGLEWKTQQMQIQKQDVTETPSSISSPTPTDAPHALSNITKIDSVYATCN
jgi:alpha-tubulin suppressor-like RCC1 family protein